MAKKIEKLSKMSELSIKKLYNFFENKTFPDTQRIRSNIHQLYQNERVVVNYSKGLIQDGKHKF